MKSKAAGCGPISTVFSSIVLLCVSSMIIMIIIIIKIIIIIIIIIDFEEDCILLDGERIEKYWKPTWTAIKARLKKGVEQRRKEEYLEK